MSEESLDRYALRGLFPGLDRPTKRSTALCAVVIDSLDEAMTLLNVGCTGTTRFNPLQREIASRFASACADFARDMLAADGDRDALRCLLELPSPTSEKPAD
ncbi:hypothetical protein [Variovorax sp. YR216]|uniref:hypothetical protein n=1 Tax=Variovorax sp. YR216 TaxID=1882828 RepID=UPI00089C7803|nr:hypothetical protein [Variovorax sp. YR216]SEB25418.1 hypothetical protein SAMN05444680_12527 [Variovorax sp. YR216]